MATPTNTIVEMALLQAIGESYLNLSDSLGGVRPIRQVVLAGNNHSEKNPNGNGATGVTEDQFAYFDRNFEIIGHYPSDQSGFSATLFRRRGMLPGSEEFSLSIRSTEYAYGSFDGQRGPDNGGDWARDGKPGADGEVSAHGFAFAQIDSMESVWAHLRAGENWNGSAWVPDERLNALQNGARVNVTGYSLGGHLATTFALLHPQDVIRAYTFNGAGVGAIGSSPADPFLEFPTRSAIAGLLSTYRDMLASGSRGRYPTGDPLWWRQMSPAMRFEFLKDALQTARGMLVNGVNGVTGIVQGNRYSWPVESFIGRWLGRTTVGLGESLLNPLDGLSDRQVVSAIDNWSRAVDGDAFGLQSALYTNGTWADRITQIFGHGEFFDPEFVANSGMHAPSTKIWIEDLPTSRGAGFMQIAGDSLRNWTADFGETHSITPLIDSMSLLSVFQLIDPNIGNDQYTVIQKAVANSSFQLGGLPGLVSALRTQGLFNLGRLLLSKLETTTLSDPDAIEASTNALARLFLGSDLFTNGPGTPQIRLAPEIGYQGYSNRANRTFLHRQLAAISSAVTGLASPQAGGTFRIEATTGLEAAELERRARAADGVAYRYSLIEGLPFAVITNTQIYNRKVEDGTLQRFNALNRIGTLTDEYIHDRAQMHAYAMRDSMSNAGGIEVQGAEAWRYASAQSGQTTYVVPTPLTRPEGTRWGELVFRVYDDSGSAHRITFGSDNADAVIGGRARDRLYAGAGNDYLRGGAENDYLEGGRGIDVYEFESTVRGGGFGTTRSDGADTVRDIDGRGVLRFTDYRSALIGSDELIGSTLVAGAFVADGQGTSRWVSLDGRTVINRLPGAADAGRVTDDLVVRRLDADGARLDGSITISDWRAGDFGIRLLDGLDLASLATTREILGGAVPDPGRVDALGNPETTPGTLAADVSNVLVGSAAADRIDGGGGNDVLRGDRAGNGAATDPVGDWLRGGAGRDWIFAGPGENLLEGGADAGDTGDILLGGARRDRIYGDAIAPLADAVLVGDAATYGVRAASQTGTDTPGDFVDGGEGADVIVTTGANDGLLGGGGADVIVAGAGDDYVLGDTHGEYPLGAFSRWRGDTFAINYTLSPDQMGPDIAPLFRGRFVGITLLPGTVMPQAAGDDLIYTGAGSDLVWGEGGDDTIDGGSGADTLNGGAGSDVLIGGLGSDFLAGDAPMDALAEQGDDILDGGAGDDALFGFAGADILFGGAGNDILEGGLGSDILVGGPGFDTLRGGRGKDTYVFNRGDGVEVIDDPDDRGRTAATDGPGANPDLSVIVLGEGISASDVKFGRGSLLIDLGQGDAIHLELAEGESDPARFRAFDRIEFADGSVLTFDDFLQRGLDLDGTERVAAHQDADGNPVPAQDGNDVLAGSDNALGGDRIRGLSGVDVIRAGAGDDTITGGRDRDTLYGGAGVDTYVFEIGDGVDTVVDGRDPSVFRFGPGIAAADLQVLPLTGIPDPDGHPADALDLHYDGAQGDHVLIVGGAAQGANQYAFADGTVLTQRDLLARFHGRMTITGGAGDDIIVGGSGDDIIEAGEGDDTLEGGDGFDRLRGGAGDDTYLFDRGAGHDVIEDTQGATTVRLGAGITADDLVVGVANAFDGGLYLRAELGADTLTVPIDFRVGSETMPTFAFEDGSTLDGRALLALRGTVGYGFAAGADAVDLAGTGAADSLFGGRGDDSLSGNGGDDLLVGGAGVDFLDGGAGADDLDGDIGDDWLYGGAGTDTYHLYRGGGLDTVFEDSGEGGVLRLEGGLALADLVAGREGDDLRLRIRRGDEGLLIKDYFTSNQTWTLVEPGGATLGLEDLLALPVPPQPVADIGAAVAAFRQGVGTALEAALMRGGYVQAGAGAWVRNASYASGDFRRDTRMQVDLVQGADTGAGPQAAPAFIQTLRADSTTVEQTATVSVQDTSQAYFVAVGLVGMVVPASPVDFVAMLGAAYADPATWDFYPGYKQPVFGPVTDLPPGIRPQPQGGGGQQLLGFYLYPDNVIHHTVPDGDGGQRTIVVVPTVERQVTTTTVTEDYAWQVNLATARAGDGGGTLVVVGGQAGIGGAGDDTLIAAGAMDLVPGALADPLRRPGVLLHGAAGDDRLYGSEGDDMLVAGTGADLLVGGGGRDRYIILPGGGTATVFDLVPDAAVGPAVRVANGANAPIAIDGGTLELPVGVAPGDLAFSWADEWLPVFRDSNRRHAIGYMADLPLKVATAVLVIDYDTVAGRGQVRIDMPHEQDAGGIASVVFADGSTWSRETLLAHAPAHSLDPNAAANVATGGALDGEGGDDTLAGAGILRGGEGDDHLAGGAGNDALTGDEGADTLAGGDGDDLLGFGIREFLGAGNEYRGGRGRDFLLGSVGADTFVFERGDGADVIGDFWHDPRYAPTAGGWLPVLIGGVGPGFEWGSAYSDAYYYSSGPDVLPDHYQGTDVLRFGAGIAPGDLSFVRARGDHYEGVGTGLPHLPPGIFLPPGFTLPGTGIIVEDATGSDLVIRIGNGGDSLRIPDFFSFGASNYQVRGTASFNAAYDRNFIGQLRFADGTVWDRARFDAALAALGNRAPVAGGGIDDITVEPGRPVDVVLLPEGFSDPNPGDTLTYRLEGVGAALPDWLRFDAQTRRLTGEAAAGGTDLALRLVATDTGGMSAALDFALRVGALNHAPVAGDGPSAFMAWEDAPGYWALPGDAFADADADDVLRYEARLVGPGGARGALPDWLGFDPDTGGLFGLAGNESVGTLDIEITAIDPAGASARRVFELQVRNVNDAPRVAGALGDVDVVAAGVTVLTVPGAVFDDVDAGDTLTLSLALLDGQGDAAALPDWILFDAAAGALRVEGGAAPAGTVRLRLTATDGAAASVATEFALHVVEGVPVVDGPPPRAVLAGGVTVAPDDAAAGGEVARPFGPLGVPAAAGLDDGMAVAGQDEAPAWTAAWEATPAVDMGAAMDAFQQAIDAFDRAFEEAAFAQARANAGVAGRLAADDPGEAAGLPAAALLDGLTRLHLEAGDAAGTGWTAGTMGPFDLGLGQAVGEGPGLPRVTTDGLVPGTVLGGGLRGLGEGLTALAA